MTPIVKASIACTTVGVGTVGFVRGYRKSKYNSKGSENLNANRIALGLANSLMYMNPLLVPFTLQKEFQKIEISSKGLSPFDYPAAYEEYFGIRDNTDIHEAREICLYIGKKTKVVVYFGIALWILRKMQES